MVVLIFGGVINVITPDINIFKKSADLANQIMLLYILLGVFFLIFANQRLMLVSLGCAALLAYDLKIKTDAKIKYAPRNHEAKISLTLANLASIDANPQKVFNYIKRTRPDIIVLQEFTPEWPMIIDQEFGDIYEYKLLIPKISVYGIGILSKIPIEKIDTIYYEEIPIINAHFSVEYKLFNIVTAYLMPNLNLELSQKCQNQLRLMSESTKKNRGPSIVPGVFNLVPWSAEIQKFKYDGELLDSRRGFIPNLYTGSLLSKPVTHIFYSEDFECIDFKIAKADNDEFGVESSFQFKNQSN